MTLVPAHSPLVQAVALLGAAVVIVPLFRRFGLGSVLGYLTAGLLIGPYGLGWFTDPEAILSVAEFGVVMFLFVIGLEMQPSKLLSLGRTMVRLGTLQITCCAIVLTGVATLFGMPVKVAFIGAMGFALTSTAIVTQQLAEQGELEQISGQRIVSVLLLEDLLVVPLLALVAWMAPMHVPSDAHERATAVIKGLVALAVLVGAGRWLLTPLFRILAQSRVREVLCAGTLLVVLGAALLMELGGLSMAMGAFVAGVLLSESTFRHQIEADVEPFRGILLGLFFLGVGMALDVPVVRAHWATIFAGVVALMSAKGISIYIVARLRRCSREESIERACLMALGGEFAFVLYANAAQAGVIDAPANASFTAIVVLSMALSPLVTLVARRIRQRNHARAPETPTVAYGAAGSVLMVGFGRFGQVVSQTLLARDVDVTVIDTDIEMVQAASDFGFKIYYGDGTRLDVMEAAGARSARIIAVCIDKREVANVICDIAMEQFPQATLVVRSYDREHSLVLAAKGVDCYVRETFESALSLGVVALRNLSVPPTEAEHIAAMVRARDAERFAAERAGVNWVAAGSTSFRKRPVPAPLTPPKRESQALNDVAKAAKASKN